MDLPPYYNEDFFAVLRYYSENSHKNVATMTIKEWYTELVQDRVLMSPATLNAPKTLIPTRVEGLFPDMDWSRTWQLARVRGLPGDLASHLWRQLHGLLPTQDRVARLGGNRGNREPGVCRLCQPDTSEDLYHSYFGCENNRHAALALLVCAQQTAHRPDLTARASLRLDLDVNSVYQVAVITLLATGFKLIWDRRCAGRTVAPLDIKAELEARKTILMNSRFYWAGQMLTGAIQDFPT